MSFWVKLRALFIEQPSRRLPRRIPPRELAPIDEIIEQGLLVADVAIRMTVKNELIVDALKHKSNYVAAHTEELVKKAVQQLILERELDSANISNMLRQINRVGFSIGQETEYGTEDSKTLKHRKAVYDGVAAQLKKWETDPEYLTKTAQKAAACAWTEIGESLATRAEHPYYSGGASAEYQTNRQERIDALIAGELQDLIDSKSHGAENTPAAAVAKQGLWARLRRVIFGKRAENV